MYPLPASAQLETIENKNKIHFSIFFLCPHLARQSMLLKERSRSWGPRRSNKSCRNVQDSTKHVLKSCVLKSNKKWLTCSFPVLSCEHKKCYNYYFLANHRQLLKYLKQIVCACPARCWPPWKLKLLTVPEGEPEKNCVQPEGARWAESQPNF